MTDRTSHLRTAALAVAVLTSAACGGDSGSGPDQTATALQVVTPPAANVAAGMPLVTAPTFVVRDQNGGAMGGVPVTISVIAGGGTITDAPARSGSGATVVGNWTLGPTVGVNRLEIAVANVKPETLSVTSVPGVPTAIAVLDNGQSAPAGRATTTPVRFVVRDQFGNGVAGRQLSIAIAQGAGTLAGIAPGVQAVVTTGADGAALAPVWTLGKSARPQQLAATLVGGTLSATANANVQTDFAVDVRYVGAAPSAAVQAAFADAAARLSAIIVGELSDVTTGGAFDVAANCGMPGAPSINEVIDDVLIFAEVKAIDGVGQILGQAGPCIPRQATPGSISPYGLPAIGRMTFDAADLNAMIANETLSDVILHEMMHVLGFGDSYFGFHGLITGRSTAAVAFTGANATRGCRDAGGLTTCAASTPLENTGGGGTINSHWRETTFGAELMTGFISGASRPLSGMTIGAFQDLGYVVNPDARDAYTMAGSVLASSRAGASLSLAGRDGWETVLRPRFTISPEGTLRPIPELP